MISNGRLMRRYLLGTATEAERTALENDYLANDVAFNELEAAENDLIDCYARGEMPIAEREAFENRYLTSARESGQSRSRVEFARALQEMTREAALSAAPRKAGFMERIRAVFRAGSVSPAWRLAGAFAIVLTVGLVSLRVLNHRGPGPTEAKRADHTLSSHQPRPADHPSESAAGTESAAGSPQVVAKNEEAQEFNAQLEPDAARSVGSGLQMIAVPSHTAWLNLRVLVDEDEARALAAVLETPDGNEVFRAERSEATTSRRGRVLGVRIPAARMPAGDYILEVTAPAGGSKKEESVTSCSFRLTYK